MEHSFAHLNFRTMALGEMRAVYNYFFTYYIWHLHSHDDYNIKGAMTWNCEAWIIHCRLENLYSKFFLKSVELYSCLPTLMGMKLKGQ